MFINDIICFSLAVVYVRCHGDMIFVYYNDDNNFCFQLALLWRYSRNWNDVWIEERVNSFISVFTTRIHDSKDWWRPVCWLNYIINGISNLTDLLWTTINVSRIDIADAVQTMYVLRGIEKNQTIEEIFCSSSFYGTSVSHVDRIKGISVFENESRWNYFC